MTKKPLNDEQRQRLEQEYTSTRIFELALHPVRGHFDAAHLREVNRRIFQDLPGAGFNDVTPGEYRKPVPEGLDWMKQRTLSTVEGSHYVAYSRMDEKAIARMHDALALARPEEMRNLKTPEFTARLAKIYTEVDYAHPFGDGNSRTLRSFTRQLARESGFDVEWEKFGKSPIGRDLLYIARDCSVNALAQPDVRDDGNRRKLIFTQDRLEGNRHLPDLLRDVVRPSRAVAFERRSEREALREYPELKEAYQTMHAATHYFASKMPDMTAAQKEARQTVLNHVQQRLNAGETADFGRDRSGEKQHHKAVPEPRSPQRDHER